MRSQNIVASLPETMRDKDNVVSERDHAIVLIPNVLCKK